MPSIPNTRYSLIARLPMIDADECDQLAWQEFVDTYEPFLYGFGRNHGMQDADARELVQLVLVSVAKSVSRWAPSEEGKDRPLFRAWLTTIARNQLINYLKLSGRKSAAGGTTNLRKLQTVVDRSPDGELDYELDYEAAYRREVFQHCANCVKEEVQSSTWRAFWATAVEGKSCAVAARELGIRVGSVYAARARVIARLKERATRLLNTERQDEL